MDEAMEEICFGLIAASGTARSQAFEALKAAKEHNMAEARGLLAASKESSIEAHHKQTELISREASGEHTEVSVILVHAQDHLSMAIMAGDLAERMVEMHRRLARLEASA